jgi:hypothetical protein
VEAIFVVYLYHFIAKPTTFCMGIESTIYKTFIKINILIGECNKFYFANYSTLKTNFSVVQKKKKKKTNFSSFESIFFF